MNENENYVDFENDIKTLEQIISDLENGELSLSKTMELYEKGKSLIQKCNKILDDARLVIKEHENF